MKIEAGKRYNTRDGRVSGIMRTELNGLSTCSDPYISVFTENGCGYKDGISFKEHPDDLVSEHVQLEDAEHHAALIKSRDETIGELHRQIESLKDVFNISREEVAGLNAKIDDLKEKADLVDVFNEANLRLGEAIAARQQELREVNRKLDVAETQVEAFRIGRDANRRELAFLARQADEQRLRAEEAEGKLFAQEAAELRGFIPDCEDPVREFFFYLDKDGKEMVYLGTYVGFLAEVKNIGGKPISGPRGAPLWKSIPRGPFDKQRKKSWTERLFDRLGL